MNPLTNIRSRQRQREQEVINGVPETASYHSDYRGSAYVYAGQLSFNLTEGDLLAVFSEYGEVVDVNLVRDKQTNKSRGFAFLAYEDQRGTDLAVDNLNGVTVDGRIISVDHVKDYKRLVDNPEHVDTKSQQQHGDNATGGQTALQSAPPSDRILSGADAEAIEDELGTSGVADVAARGDMIGGRSADGLLSGAPRTRGPSTIAQMLREVESQIGDWRNRKAVAEGSGRATRVEPDVEDPMAAFARGEKRSRKGEGKAKQRYKEKSDKKSSHRSRTQRSGSRSRSPLQRNRSRDSKVGGSQRQGDRHRRRSCEDDQHRR